MMDSAEHSQPTPTVSVIIAVRNDAPGLRVTLDALRNQDLSPADFEVIVIDDASTDETPTAARSYPRVRLDQMAQSGGSYAARNVGLRLARGEFIAITDADCRPQPDWLRQGVRYLQEDNELVIAGLIEMPLTSSSPLAAMVDVMVHLDQERYVTKQGTAATANLFGSAATFAAVGAFDERLRSSGDAEWTRRAGRLGHRVIFAREAVVIHPPRATPRALVKKATRVGRGARVASRHGLLDMKPLYLSPRCLIPWERARGRQRLWENGVKPTWQRWLILGVAQVVLVQLPQALAALRFDLSCWRRRRSRL